MKQEQFEKSQRINEAIKLFEGTIEKLNHSHMEMRLDGFAEEFFGHSNMVREAYNAYIPKEERDKLTAEMRERLKAALTQRIKELKAEFDKI